MRTLAEIKAAAESLPPEQKEELLRFLTAQIHAADKEPNRARLVRRDNDVLLEAPRGAPPMTPENVKRLLEDWP